MAVSILRFGSLKSTSDLLILYKKSLDFNLSGNEVYYTYSCLLAIHRICVVNFVAREFSNVDPFPVGSEGCRLLQVRDL